MKLILVLSLSFGLCVEALLQDSVDVTFRHEAPSPNAWKLADEFTNWGTNAITVSTADNINYTCTACYKLRDG